jgi:hypothetical protein
VLILDGDRIAVYTANPSLKGAAKYRVGLVGYLETSAQITAAAKDETTPSGKLEGDVAVLSTTIPYLNSKAQPATGGSSPGIRVTIRLPFLRKVERPKPVEK